ncbi:MAG: polysaccharide biosynthesis protein [Promicromonosporaceae bacterium]|nr:polysaccharide biosynthesis protein [Promicromonosporaceae bacterium]
MFVSHETIARLSQEVTGRKESMFAPALAAISDSLATQIAGARVLVTGGAGFIATQTIRQLLAYSPAKLVLADTWENGLAEAVRTIRSGSLAGDGVAIEPRLVDVTSPLVDRMIADDGPFDLVLAFAAAKHVRSERDPVSALQMLNTNVFGTLRVIRNAVDGNPDCRVFMVSTDKAADPASLMGASKRFMERAVFASIPQATTTRFANVAFSNGSLLESWLQRLANNQMLPVPAETSRFFVQPVEAGQLCLVAAFAPPGSICVPSPDTIESTDLQVALDRVLATLDLRGVPADTDTTRPGEVPVLVTARDTAGEKSSEVFVGADEVSESWLHNLDVINVGTTTYDVDGALEWLADAWAGSSRPPLSEIISGVSRAVPEFSHIASSKRLDDRI